MRLTDIYRQDNLVQFTFSDGTRLNVSCGNRQEALILDGVLQSVWRIVPMDDVSITPPERPRDLSSLTDEQYGKVVRVWRTQGPIPAIKEIRTITKWGLYEAKVWFDAYVKNAPAVYTAF